MAKKKRSTYSGAVSNMVYQVIDLASGDVLFYTAKLAKAKLIRDVYVTTCIQEKSEWIKGNENVAIERITLNSFPPQVMDINTDTFHTYYSPEQKVSLKAVLRGEGEEE